MGAMLGAFAQLEKVTINFVTPVCPSEWNNPALITRFSWNLRAWIFF